MRHNNNATLTLAALLSLAPLVSAGDVITPAEEAAIRRSHMEEQVRKKLVRLPYYGAFDHLAFQTDGEKVRLEGKVHTPWLKDDAVRAALSVEGVESVDNQIEVLPLSGHDDGLRRALYRAIYGDPSLQVLAIRPNHPIRILVENGHVTLEGVVDNEAQKNIAGLKANSVPGTFSVVNNLRVPERS